MHTHSTTHTHTHTHPREYVGSDRDSAVCSIPQETVGRQHGTEGETLRHAIRPRLHGCDPGSTAGSTASPRPGKARDEQGVARGSRQHGGQRGALLTRFLGDFIVLAW